MLLLSRKEGRGSRPFYIPLRETKDSIYVSPSLQYSSRTVAIQPRRMSKIVELPSKRSALLNLACFVEWCLRLWMLAVEIELEFWPKFVVENCIVSAFLPDITIFQSLIRPWRITVAREAAIVVVYEAAKHVTH
jgi:hypothetical protein